MANHNRRSHYRRAALLLVACMGVAGLVGCDNPATTEPISNKFIGTWRNGTGNNYMQYSFSSSNVSFYGTSITTINGIIELWELSGSGTWWVKGDTLYTNMSSSMVRTDYIEDTIVYSASAPLKVTWQEYVFEGDNTLSLWSDGWVKYGKR